MTWQEDVGDGEPGEEIRSLLDAGANDVVDYDFDRGLAMHLTAIGIPLATAAATAAAATAGGVGEAAGGAGGSALVPAVASSKAWLGLLTIPFATATVAAALWFGGSSTDKPVSGPAPQTATEPTQAKTPTTSVDGVQADDTSGPAEAAIPGSAQADSKSSHRSAAKQAAHSARSAHRANKAASPVSATGPVAATESLPTPNDGTSSPVTEERAAVPPVGPSAEERLAEEAQRQKRAEFDQAKQTDRLREEMEALMEAKRALGRNPAQALALARDGEHKFGRSTFSEERQHVLILALLEIGRTVEARRLAAPYIQAHPGSPFAKRVQKALDASSSR